MPISTQLLQWLPSDLEIKSELADMTYKTLLVLVPTEASSLCMTLAVPQLYSSISDWTEHFSFLECARLFFASESMYMCSLCLKYISISPHLYLLLETYPFLWLGLITSLLFYRHVPFITHTSYFIVVTYLFECFLCWEMGIGMVVLTCIIWWLKILSHF